MKKLNRKMNESSRYDGTPSINSTAKKFLLQRTRKRLDEIGQRLSDVSDDVRTALGDDSDLFSWVESLRGDTLDTIDIVDYEIENSSAVNEGSDPSNCESSWFDKMGDMKKHLPMDCILDCSSGGSVDDSVDYWVNELNFHVPTEKGLSYVQEYGLDDIGPEDVDKYVLWIMCGNIKEEAYEFCRDGSEWDYVDKDAYPEDMDDWGEEDWDRFQDEVAVCHLGM